MSKRNTKKEQFTLHLSDEQSVFVSEKRDEVKSKKAWNGWYYVELASDMGFTIALPMVAGALIGKYIDAHWRVYPSATIIALGIGSIVSFLGFIRTVQELMRKK